MKMPADYQRKHSGLGCEKARVAMKANRFSALLTGICYSWRQFQHEVSRSNVTTGAYRTDRPWWWCPSVLTSLAHCCLLLALEAAGRPAPASFVSTSYSPPLQKHTTNARGSCDGGFTLLELFRRGIAISWIRDIRGKTPVWFLVPVYGPDVPEFLSPFFELLGAASTTSSNN